MSLCSDCIHDGECDDLPYCGGCCFVAADDAEPELEDYDWYDQREEDEYAAENWLARNEP